MADEDRPGEAGTATPLAAPLADNDRAESVGGLPAEDSPSSPNPTVTEGTDEPGPARDGLGDTIEDPDLPEDGTWIRIVADRQAMDVQRQVVTATGDVRVQFGRDNITADHLWINLNHRYLRAEGGVLLNRNQQVLEGETATYNLLQGAGSLTQARGSLQIATLTEDFSTTFPNDLATDALDPFNARLQGQGSISQVTSPGGVSFSLNGAAAMFGSERSDLGRLRFEAGSLSFDASGWYGENLRMTNDPFSPPELELRGNRVSFIPNSEAESELCIENPRLVFDQRLSLPLLRPCYQFQNGELPANFLNPLMINLGYDSRDRDGFFIDREFPVFAVGDFQVAVAPQFYLSRWLGESGGDLFDPANVGLVARARGNLGPRTATLGFVSLPGLDLGNFADRVRAKLRVQRLVGNHRLGVEYTYRDRLFNGTLGFQDVQTSAGLLLESPVFPLGESGLDLSYQVSGQYVTATTDRPDLLEPGIAEGLVSLFRTQGAVDLSRRFLLWQGEAKPSTATEGLRFSPRPLVPSLSLAAGLRGVGTYYSSNNFQESLDVRVQLSGQVGHLSRNYLDYTQFNLGLFRGFIGGNDSPFLFDRQVDSRVISGGLVQQIYGPVLLGVQTAFNLNTGQEIDTSFSLEYRRRSYGLVAHYSPTRETGFLGFRLSQFDWAGPTDPFDRGSLTPTLEIQ
ncbi:MAG: DUF3769 domain-containing protein [Leptolyngbya sp.]|nr:DUF3769 domain-containing protein [Leptolyngbya sp.]